MSDNLRDALLDELDKPGTITKARLRNILINTLATDPDDSVTETRAGTCPTCGIDLDYPTALHILDCPPVGEAVSACEFCGFKDDNAGSKYWRCSQCGCEDFEMVTE